MLSYTEENYLKAVLKLSLDQTEKAAGTNTIASYLNVKPASATDMLKKLKEKSLIFYEKYGKITLSDSGKSMALDVLRKHRLWETFLFQKLGFSWDELHEVAEQLEHIQSNKLTEKLDAYLGYPLFDPHGDAIPNAKGELILSDFTPLSEVKPGLKLIIMTVKDNSATFLKYVSQLGLAINDVITVLNRQEFDGSLEILIGEKTVTVSHKFAENILGKIGDK
jgi:DtxR family Mn-dependent transcriptional regulator